MGSSSKGSSQAGSAIEFKIRVMPHYLSKEEDDERIKRLSRKILACIAASERDRRGNKLRKHARASDILGSEDETIFGN